MQLRQGKIIQKQKMQELSSLFMTHRINVMHALVKFHEYIPYNGPDTVNYMEPSQGEIIQKPKMQELSSLFMTHHINVMHALVKFHEYIPYSLGVMAPTRFTIWKFSQGEIIQKSKMQELSSLFMTHCLIVM